MTTLCLLNAIRDRLLTKGSLPEFGLRLSEQCCVIFWGINCSSIGRQSEVGEWRGRVAPTT